MCMMGGGVDASVLCNLQHSQQGGIPMTRVSWQDNKRCSQLVGVVEMSRDGVGWRNDASNQQTEAYDK